MLLRGREVLAIFARWPEPGRVKTRLAAGIGNDSAARVYDRMLKALFAEHRGREYDVIAFITPPEKLDAFQRTYETAARIQRGSDLGARMAHCFEILLREYDRVTLAGSDIPGLTADRVTEAFGSLEIADVALGPCPDGGYYLIASQTPPDVLTGIPWSTSYVLSLTIDRLLAEGRTYAFLPLERDVDYPADLEVLSHER